MKAKLLPLYFKERNPRETREFEEQLKKAAKFSTARKPISFLLSRWESLYLPMQTHSIPPASRSCLSVP